MSYLLIHPWFVSARNIKMSKRADSYKRKSYIVVTNLNMVREDTNQGGEACKINLTP